LIGGRFNLPGIPTLYLAQDADLATRESTQSAALAQLKLFAPRTIVCVRLRLKILVPLDDPTAAMAVGMQEADLCAPWPASADEPTACQLLGQRLFLAGVEGIRYRSAIDGSRMNYAIFRDNLQPGSLLEVVQSDDPADH
jgi:RES domain-containing protein